MMKKNKFLIGFFLITLIAALTACGHGKTNASNAELPAPTKAPAKTLTEDSTETAVEEDLTEVKTAEEPIIDEDEILTVVNNNGHFVEFGDKIYFHVADADSLGQTAIGARFADQQTGRTVLFEYDIKKGEVKDIAFDFTSGGISVQGNALYTLAYKDNLEQPDEPETFLGKFTMKDGLEAIDLAASSDTLLGAGLNDSFIAAIHYDYVDNREVNQILIYKDGAHHKSIDVEHYRDCVTLGDNMIFFISGEPETGYNLKQVNVTTDEIIDLGKLPSFEYSDWNGMIDEVIFDGAQIYFTYSSYEGTGYFFSQGFFVQAKAGAENSIDYVDMPTRMEDGEPRAAKFAVQNGQMVVCEGEPGTCEVNGSGTLGYYNDDGEWVEVADGWENVFFDEDGNYKGVELAEKVGDAIFLIYNENERVPEDDIGWRYAYCRNYTNVYRISIETGESTRLVHQAAPWSD